MGENQEDAIIEEREELMVSPSGGNPSHRPAHFLKPSVTSIKGSVCHLPSGTFCSPTSTSPTFINPPLNVEFRGCQDPLRKWKSWFDHMHSVHQSTWKKAGIYEAIVNSTYCIPIDKDIVMGLAEKWCFDTNTFVFDWGEGTITLEDVLVLGGFSVLGKSVLTPLENRELIEIYDKLMKGRREIPPGKATIARQHDWTRHYMESRTEIEHEAFLVLWLSRHVFPSSVDLISKHVLNVAIHLARGTRIALAPAVLSWLYRDLRLLKNAIFSEKVLNVGLNLWAPMKLVQIWAWERFPMLRPRPNPLNPGEPRLAKWNNVKKKNIANVCLALSSARECFQWRPYTISENNWVFPKFYKEREEWISFCLGMDEDFESFARFLRPCELVNLRIFELVGFDSLERYLPHRVAMQFGMDQDLPGLVPRFNNIPEVAWENYSRPIKDGRLYVPSRLYKSDVTTRYLEWWKQLKLAQKDAVKGANGEKSITMSLRKPPEEPKGKNVENDALGTPTKRKRVNVAKSGGKDEKSNTKSPEKSLQISKRKNVENDVLLTHPKRKRVNKGAKPVGKDKHGLVDSAGKRMSGNGKRFLCPQPRIPSFLTADNVAGKKMGYQVEHGKNTTRGEAMIGGPHRPCANVIESSDRIPSDGVSIANNGGNISIQSTTDISGLEVKTSKLERVFDQLKAKRLGVKVSQTVDNVVGKKMEYQEEHGKNTMRGKAIIGGSHRPCANVIENSDRIPSDWVSIANNGGNISTQSTNDISGLEVRKSKRVRVFAQLKAERLGVKVSLTADNVAGKKTEYQVEHGKNTARGESIIGGSHRPCANVIESSDRIPSDGVSIANNRGNIGTQSTTDILSELEVRTSKLEIVVAQLKAERLGAKVFKT
ncbi:hypothetical protein RHSIM_Rhsim06G0217900 [Rhododendron simsii]|uniref:Aminotransferase-like plant mobile domain-containing protein n=1 Tax=Rhododendron simsii TaxID=118357 RepID=A0A834LL73_RHOSS|nr:hypothetical protein RHSIM_Rhsim06G0217900 [Rhododendron simsii]